MFNQMNKYQILYPKVFQITLNTYIIFFYFHIKGVVIYKKNFLNFIFCLEMFLLMNLSNLILKIKYNFASRCVYVLYFSNEREKKNKNLFNIVT